MKLYYSPAACSLAPHIALCEAGLPHTLERVSMKTHQLADGTDFYAINPLGYVPVLALNSGEQLRECSAILQFIADQVPDKQLAPANGKMARYRLQEWLGFISTELHQPFGQLFNPTTPENFKPALHTRLLQRLQWVDGQLANQLHLMGEPLTVADIYLFTVVNWGGFVGVDVSGLAHLSTFQARLSERPAVQAALRAEGLIA